MFVQKHEMKFTVKMWPCVKNIKHTTISTYILYEHYLPVTLSKDMTIGCFVVSVTK